MTRIPPIAVLAGGLATRLGELTTAVPKSLLDVQGEPFIAHQLRQLRRLGAKDIVMCVGHLAKSIEDFVGDGSVFGVSVTYSYDGANRQGTGGAINQALGLLGDEFLLTYGDSFIDLDLLELTQMHRNSKLPATMAIYKNDGLWDRSNVRLKTQGTILYERDPASPSDFIDYGISILSRAKFAALSPGGAWELPRFFEELSVYGQLGGYVAKKRFFEIGSTIGLAEFRKHIRERGIK